MTDDYKNYLSKTSKNYFEKSVVKTEQQRFLETLLPATLSGHKIADVACGSGTLSYHLNQKYADQDVHFTLIDYFDDVLDMAKKLNPNSNFSFENGNIYQLSQHADDSFDYVFCWQTLSWVDEPEKALNELVRITRPGGKLYLSALFNLDFDVDIYAKVLNKSEKAVENIPVNYHTISVHTINNWIGKSCKNIQFHRFEPNIDFHYSGRGLGTFTVNSDKGRLQISGGLLMNWAILEIEK